MKRATLLISCGALFAFLAVLLGAFGAHAMKGRLAPVDYEIFQTGVTYQMYHALALVMVGIYSEFKNKLFLFPAMAFVAGIILFSGSLYLLVLTQIRKFGIITPIGGFGFLIGWIAFAYQVWKSE